MLQDPPESASSKTIKYVQLVCVYNIYKAHTQKELHLSTKNFAKVSSFYCRDQTRCLNWGDVALNSKRPWLPSRKVFQEMVQQYQNNLQAGFPLWRLGIWVACEEERRELSTEKLDCWFGIDAFNKNKKNILCQTPPADTLFKKKKKLHTVSIYVFIKLLRLSLDQTFCPPIAATSSCWLQSTC